MNIIQISTLLGFFLFPTPAQAIEVPFISPEVPTVIVETLDTKIDRYAKQYAVSSSAMKKTIMCESGGRADAVNWSDTHKLSKGSHGIAQFSKETIKGFGKAIGIENADPYNVDQSLEVMAYMFSQNKAFHWTCYRTQVRDV